MITTLEFDKRRPTNNIGKMKCGLNLKIQDVFSFIVIGERENDWLNNLISDNHYRQTTLEK